MKGEVIWLSLSCVPSKVLVGHWDVVAIGDLMYLRFWYLA